MWQYCPIIGLANLLQKPTKHEKKHRKTKFYQMDNLKKLAVRSPEEQEESQWHNLQNGTNDGIARHAVMQRFATRA